MNDTELKSVCQVNQFLAGSTSITFAPTTTAERYAWLARTLKRLNYHQLTKGEKGIVRAYLATMTGYSRPQLTRLIAQHRERHGIGRRQRARHTFPKRYTLTDIVLLAKTDECHQTLSGPATKKLFERAYQLFGDPAYEGSPNRNNQKVA
jgi:hypothetical protein